VKIPSGRIVSRVQVELTAVKLCIYESEVPTVDFVFADASNNDPNPLLSTKILSDNCGCNICPERKEGLDWSVTEKQWSDSKQFILDVNFQGDNSTLCIGLLTIKLHFASKRAVIHTFIRSFVYSRLVQCQKSQRSSHQNHPMITAV
jgi:hypothetical protein